MKFPFALRFSIPAILLLLGGTLSLFSYQREVSRADLRTEADLSLQARFTGDQSSGMIEYLFRRSDAEGAELVISKLGSDLLLKSAVLSDENNQVVLSTRYDQRRQPFTQVINIDLAQLNRVRQTKAGLILLSDDRQRLQAIYPVVLGTQSDALRPTPRTGVLFLEYDLSPLKQRAKIDALVRSLETSAVLSGFCLLLWLFFDQTLTKRAIKLVKATDSLAAGELGVRSRLGGSDELQQISTAFDRMAVKIQSDQQQLSAIAQRKEVLNQLTHQIRYSLDVKQILETAVNEIQALFNIARCKFAWIDQVGSGFDYMAYHPDYKERLQGYSIRNVPSFKELLLTHTVLQIDDISTDPRLDPSCCKVFMSFSIRSLLSISVQTRSGRHGFIVCEHCDQPRYWSEDDLQLLLSVADQVAIAIDQAELYEQATQSAKIAAAQAEELGQALKQLQQAQAQLIQTEKMSSLGQLVAGIAHEINNPVSFIHGNLTHVENYTKGLVKLIRLYEVQCLEPGAEIQALQSELDLNFLLQDLPQLLASMQTGTDRIGQIVLSLRNFSRLDEADMKPVNIHEGIDSTLLILKSQLRSLGQEIQVIKQYGNLPLVECYPCQLNQVFVNILKNAIEALQQTQSGTITITTQLLMGDRISISIKDNGPGMTEAVKARVFDPFFTTKAVGQGTGLGLSICYQIVCATHGGYLKCDSVEGAEFTIEIPVKQSKELSDRTQLRVGQHCDE